MAGQREFAVMRGDDKFCPDIFTGLRRFLGQHVDVMPCEVVLAVFSEHAVKAAELLANDLKMRAIAAIARVIKAALWRDEGHAAPERGILLEETARKMLRRQDMDGERSRKLDFRIPVFFVDAVFRKAPLLKIGADAERADDVMNP